MSVLINTLRSMFVDSMHCVASGLLCVYLIFAPTVVLGQNMRKREILSLTRALLFRGIPPVFPSVLAAMF